jgi:hypothetical protein
MLRRSRFGLRFQPRDEVGVFLAGQAALERCLHIWSVTAHQGRRVEPQARKNFAPIEAGCVDAQRNENTLARLQHGHGVGRVGAIERVMAHKRLLQLARLS